MSGQERDVEALAGAALIAAERRRQIEVEGWSIEHDREHGVSLLLRAAKAYEFDRMDYWPWDRKWWKPKDVLSNLIRAGALYQAAVDLGGYTGGAEAGVSRCAAKIDGILSSPVLAERDARIKAEALREAADDGPCQECGQSYSVWWAPHDLWNQVMGGPGATDDPGGMLCPTCFTARVAAADIRPMVGQERDVEALVDLISEARDEYPRRADDMDSGELAERILNWLDARADRIGGDRG